MILGIYGSGGLGREVLELAKQINKIQKRWTEVIFIDDMRTENIFQACRVVSYLKLLKEVSSCEIEIVIAVGEPNDRKKLAEKVTSNEYILSTLIHPNVYIPDSTTIGEGVVICSNAYISCDVTIGNNAYIQPNALVGHNTIIGNNSVISPSVNIAGACQIGCNTYIGMNACVKEETHIGDDTIIGIASVVIRDIPSEMIALGNPARPMKKNEERRVFK